MTHFNLHPAKGNEPSAKALADRLIAAATDPKGLLQVRVVTVRLRDLGSRDKRGHRRAQLIPGLVGACRPASSPR